MDDAIRPDDASLTDHCWWSSARQRFPEKRRRRKRSVVNHSSPDSTFLCAELANAITSGHGLIPLTLLKIYLSLYA